MAENNQELFIAENLQKLHDLLPEGIELVAVSKFQSVGAIKEAFEVGQTVFGESRVQELLEKIPLLPSDIKWHFIGHLQTNKVKSVVGKTALIQSVDSTRLLDVIEEESAKKNVVTNVLLQVHVAEEETKFGFSPAELKSFFDTVAYNTLTHTKINGLMAMATNTDDVQKIRRDFTVVSDLFRYCKASLYPSGREFSDFRILSMGMSGDWPIAIEEGATMIRVGSSIFGGRG